ncbi:MAG: dTMP kinase [Marinilabiliales bacterium]|nr:MAG: dTMP kinase [Marinilabiliales bacterium]
MAFLVIEGLDGSGKSTQVRMLRDYLDKEGTEYSFIHFPRTETGVFGQLISMFLRGDLGKIGDVNPYLVALLYAADRHDAKKEMFEWLSDGKLLVADRYVISNIAYQCAKLKTTLEKNQLAEWITCLEFVKYGIPRPDLNIFLDVPFEFTMHNLGKSRSGDERAYLGGNTDIHEADLEFQKKVRQVYNTRSETDPSVMLIPCYDENMAMLPPGKIFERILELLRNENIIV